MEQFNQDLCQFLNDSPTPFHAVASMKTRLLANNYKALDEKDLWGELKPGRYFVTRNDS
jgi:aspartyl aminopeptidase